MLSRTGYLVRKGDTDPDLKKTLTVRAVENAMGITAPSFKVFREAAGYVCVPRYFGVDRFGPPTRDARPTPAFADIQFSGVLRDETRQNEAFAAGMRAFAEVGGGVLSLDAGFGKTIMALAFSSHLKVRTMIIVHKEFLANQWKERIQQFCPGATIGRVQQDKVEVQCDFVIAMIQTLCSREHTLGLFDSVGLLIVDEAHHIGAAAFSQTMFKVCPRYTLGLTATPERKDGLTCVMYWFLGPEFFRVQRKNQKQVRVVTLDYNDVRFREGPPVTRFGKVNLSGMITELTELPWRNELVLDTVRGSLKENRRILVLTDRRAHCDWLLEEFGTELAGLYVGAMKEEDLNESAKRRIVIATFSMAQEGLDIPVLDTVVLVTPKSDVTQAVGRILRETKGKVNDPLIFDIADRWSLLHSMYRKRLALYQAAGFLIDGGEAEEAAPQFIP
jgi:superfamily II DNA or RNA helicase